jgi:hypothetical protein
MKAKTGNSFLRPGLSLGFAGGLSLIVLAGMSGQPASASPLLADISVNIGVDAGPPPPREEVIVASPGPDYIWIAGYWDGAPGHYSWTRGHWERPPHGGAHWLPPRWERGNDGHYRKVEGGWR